MEVEIYKLNHNGEGMGKIDGKIVFIEKTIPGDIVELSDVIEYQNFSRAKIKRIIQSSDFRVPIECPYYQKCGGCHLMGLSYKEQLLYKRGKVKNILHKYANLDLELKIIGGEVYHYRNKITLQVEDGQIGLFQPNSTMLVPISHCFLISPKMNQFIQQIQAQINLQQVDRIMIREAQNKYMIQIIGTTDEKTLIDKLFPDVTSLYLNNKKISGLETLTEQLGEYQFLMSPASFFQVNHSQTINLYNQVKKYLGNQNNHILDLYCGTGTIGIYVSSCCKKITGIELNPSSVKDARKNIAINKLNNIEILEGDVGKILKEKGTYDAIIVDPPRSGLDKRTRKTLLKLRSPKIIYISCNPITLARDLNELKQSYELKDIKLFDMFPNTYHVECCTLLSLKEK